MTTTATQTAQGPTSRESARNSLFNYHQFVQAGSFGQAQDTRDYLLRWVPEASRDRAKAIIMDAQLVLMELQQAGKHAQGDFTVVNALNEILAGYVTTLLELETDVR